MKNIRKKKNGIYEARMRVRPWERIVYRSLGTKDKSIAQQRCDKLYRELEREAFGVAGVTRKERAAAEKPLEKHMRPYLEHLSLECKSDRYIAQVENKLVRLFKECGWNYVKDVHMESFNKWRASHSKLSPSTLNQYLCAATGLMDWLEENDYIESNPLKKIKWIKGKKWEEDSPRALNRKEADALLAVGGPREALYLTAILTGMRRGELKQLQVRDIILDCEAPHILIRSTVAKNGKARRAILHDDLIDHLREIKKSKSPDEHAFAFPTWKTFQKDLERAGIDKRDEQGRKVSFHSLRHTCCTTAQIAGMEPRMIQEMMGHTDPKMTNQTYTDVAQFPMRDAVNRIPSYRSAPPYAPPRDGSEGLNVSHSDKEASVLEFAKLLGSKEFCEALAQIGAEGKWWAIQNSNL